MKGGLGPIVTDAWQLIALSCPTMPGVHVVIPDMVYFEVTSDLAKIGAEDELIWARQT